MWIVFFNKRVLEKEMIEGFMGHSHGFMSLDRYDDRFSTQVLWKECVQKILCDSIKWNELKSDWRQRTKPKKNEICQKFNGGVN